MKAGMGLLIAVFGFVVNSAAHVTFRSEQRLVPGQRLRVTLNVPNERTVELHRVVLEVPETFLRAGGRLERMAVPPGWDVAVENDPSQGDAQTAGTTEPADRPEPRKITFQGRIAPDGSARFDMDVLLPQQTGTYYFPVAQVFADDTTVSWVATNREADRPAAALVVEPRFGLRHLAVLVAVLALLVFLLRPVRRYKQWRRAAAGPP